MTAWDPVVNDLFLEALDRPSPDGAKPTSTKRVEAVSSCEPRSKYCCRPTTGRGGSWNVLLSISWALLTRPAIPAPGTAHVLGRKQRSLYPVPW